MPSSEMLTASTAMMRMRFIRMTPISFGIQNTRNAAYSAGSGHADSQKASPWYSCSSHRLQRTAVKRKMALSITARVRQMTEVLGRNTGCALSSSASAFSTMASRVHTDIITADTENRNMVWLIDTFRSVRQRSSQKLMMSSGMSRKFVSMSSMQHTAAPARPISVIADAPMA